MAIGLISHGMAGVYHLNESLNPSDAVMQPRATVLFDMFALGDF